MRFRAIDAYNDEAQDFERALNLAFPAPQWHVARYSDLAARGIARDELELPDVLYVRCQVGEVAGEMKVSRHLLRHGHERRQTVQHVGQRMLRQAERLGAVVDA